MMTADTIRKLLIDRSIKTVSDATGLHVNTIASVRDSDGLPSYRTLEALSDYFEAQAELYK